MLTNKYIKYSPEITYEIFEKIWNKLIDSGWVCVDNAIECYKDFSNDYSYLVPDSPTGKKFISYHVLEKGLTEISYKTFLNSEDTLMDKAKRDYPIGTKFRSSYSSAISTIVSLDFKINSEGDVSDSKGFIVYNKALNEWGEIIEKPNSTLDLLKYAEATYKKGMEIISSHSNRQYILSGESFKIDQDGDVIENTSLNRPVLYSKKYNKWSEIVKKPVLKIGDIVRVTKARNSTNMAHVGYIGTLTYIDSSESPYRVDSSWCDDVELVLDTKKWWEILKDGDFVVSLTTDNSMRTKDFVYKIRDQKTGSRSIRYIRNDGSQGGTTDVGEFRLATPEEAALYKQAGKSCSIIPPVKNSPNDQELLDYANKHFIVGTKFISIVPADGKKERTCNYYRGESSFGWEKSLLKGKTIIRTKNGLDNTTGCSNPYIYEEGLGWAKITFDASEQPLKKIEEIHKYDVEDSVEYQGSPTKIAAICNDSSYIVEYSEGWTGNTNFKSIKKGSLNSSIKYHYAYEKDLYPLRNSSTFKEGDWVYCDFTPGIEDCRQMCDSGNTFIPTFQVKQIYGQHPNCWLRPIIGQSSGVLSKNCRLATNSEIELAKKPLKRAINVKTKEQWNIVTTLLNYSWTTGKWEQHCKDSCISLQGTYYGSLSDYKSYQILSFEEFMQEYNPPNSKKDTLQELNGPIFIADTMEMPIKKKIRPLKKQVELKFTNN